MAPDRKRILVVEDDMELVDLLKFSLSEKGYDVLIASSGTKALIIAKNERPDLILLDIMLPEMDGYHVAKELSETMGANCPKILIMTSRDTIREKGIILMSGATSVLQKPFTMDDLHEEISKIFTKDYKSA